MKTKEDRYIYEVKSRHNLSSIAQITHDTCVVCCTDVCVLGLRAGDGDRVVAVAAQLNLITPAGRDTSLLVTRHTSHVIRDTHTTWQTDT